MTRLDLPTVLIVNYRTSGITTDLAHSIRRRYPSIPLSIVDNSVRAEDWDELVKNLPPHTRAIRSDRNVGFGTAINAELPLIETSRTLLLNPDLGTVPSIERLVETANETRATIVGALTVDDRGISGSGGFGGPPRLRTFARYALPLPANERSLMGRVRAGRAPLDVGWVSGACMLIETRAIRELGFDESLFLYAEDIDLCWRHLAVGERIVLEPRVTIEHRAGTSSGGRPPLLWVTNLALVMERWIPLARVFLVVGLLERGILAVLTRRTGHGRFLLRSARAATRQRVVNP